MKNAQTLNPKINVLLAQIYNNLIQTDRILVKQLTLLWYIAFIYQPLPKKLFWTVFWLFHLLQYDKNLNSDYVHIHAHLWPCTGVWVKKLIAQN